MIRAVYHTALKLGKNTNSRLFSLPSSQGLGAPEKADNHRERARSYCPKGWPATASRSATRPDEDDFEGFRAAGAGLRRSGLAVMRTAVMPGRDQIVGMHIPQRAA